jgi:hypothetical protein
MVTLEEEHSTRGRSRILYEMLQGDTITDGFRSGRGLRRARPVPLLQGPQGDCPVDMAGYKAEFLSRHYRRRLRPPAAYSMGLIMFHARLASLAPRLASRVAGLRPLKRLAGISPRPAARAPAAGSTTWRTSAACSGGRPVTAGHLGCPGR